MFLSTSTCDATPTYPVNLVMCFLMGLEQMTAEELAGHKTAVA